MKKSIITTALAIGLMFPAIQGNAQQIQQIKPVEVPKETQAAPKDKKARQAKTNVEENKMNIQTLEVKDSKEDGMKEFDNAEFKEFADRIEKELSQFYNASAETNWNASISGKDEDFETAAKADMSMNEFLSNKETFKQIKAFKSMKQSSDPILARRLVLLYNTFAPYQIETELLNKITLLQSSITKKFQNFRALAGGKELTDNQIEAILGSSKDSRELEEAWKAHKKIGELVSEDIINLVKMRNEQAQALGYENFHTMSLQLNEQDPNDILKLFDQLDDLTGPAFQKLKEKMDSYLAKRCSIKPEELMPWHYQNRYFQEAPKIYDINLDEFYAGKDIVKITEEYYSSIGLDIKDLLQKSDLFDKPGKNQHAFCTDIDRDKGDVRVLCNVQPNAQWMNTMLHEYGHAVYTKYHNKELPWILKTAAHTFTTEAIAMMFGRMASNPIWMKDMLGLNQKDFERIKNTCDDYLRLEQLCFSRWSQVMFRFEKALYADPDQDLNALWWNLVEKYQGMKKPEGRNAPDWATKIHIATFPCYYHNYHLGELLASQLYFTLKERVLNSKEANVSFKGNPKVGHYLQKMVFGPGAELPWNQMIERATGRPLTPEFYAKQFVK